MRAAILFALVLAACVSSPAAPTGGAENLNLFADGGDPHVISDEFGREIATRYPAPASLAVLDTDFTANGFTCANTPPVEARSDYLKAHCERFVLRHGPECRDEWRIDLRFAPGTGDLARPSGSFWRSCS